MPNRTRFTFTLRRFLCVPIIFAVLFWLIPEPAAMGYVFVAAIALSLLLFLTNVDNLATIITCALGCLIGGSMGMPIIHSSKIPRPTMSGKFVEITIGVIVGCLFIRVIESFLRVLFNFLKPTEIVSGVPEPPYEEQIASKE